MIEFKILKKSGKSRARIGVLETPRGAIETPAFVPVATQAAVKTLEPEEAIEAKSQLLICNTFHLHLKPGEAIVKKAGGLHRFMNWQRPLMTDSGGFQVFSLGFGSDKGVGKFMNQNRRNEIKAGDQPKLLTLSEDGVLFRSLADGRKIFIGPKESMKIQKALGADIIFAFDECPPPLADYGYVRQAVSRTHRWAIACLKHKSARQALYGIVQGSRFKALRIESARFISRLDFDGFGIGGEFGNDKRRMREMLGVVNRELPEGKPRHLLGIGHPEDILPIIMAGVDTFDCIAPTHYARHGVAFTSKGRLDLSKALFLRDLKPLDSRCSCRVCRNYSRSYIRHLLKAKEIGALKLLTFHNLYFFNSLVEKLRYDIKRGRL